MLFVLLLVISLISTIASEIWTAHHAILNWYIGFDGKLNSTILYFVNIFFAFKMDACNIDETKIKVGCFLYVFGTFFHV